MNLQVSHIFGFNWIALSRLHEKNEDLFLVSELGGLGLEPLDVEGHGKIDILTLHGREPVVNLSMNERALRTEVSLFPDKSNGLMRIQIPPQTNHISLDEDQKYIFSIFPNGQNIVGDLEDAGLTIHGEEKDISQIDDPTVIDEILRVLSNAKDFVGIIQEPSFAGKLDTIRTKKEELKRKFGSSGFGFF